MDLKRIIILIPIAILAYLMVMQWNKDYHQPNDSQQNSTVAQQQANKAASTGNGPQVPGSDNQSSANGDATQGSLDNASNGSGASSLIDVNTNVLQLHINPEGGDIVYAALPKQTKSLDSKAPFVLLDNSKSLDYIARSGIQLGGKSDQLHFSADQTDYTLSPDQKQLVVNLHTSVNGIQVTKRFTLTRGSYAVRVDYLLNNQSNAPINAQFVGELARDQSPDPTESHGMGAHSYLGAAFSTPDSRYQKVSFDDIRDHDFHNMTANGGWVSIIQQYFVSAWVPNAKQSNLYYGRVDNASRTVAGFAGPQQQIAAGSTGTLGATLYVGPKYRDQLLATAPNLQLTIDYGWLWFLSTPLFWLLSKIHSLIGNWGWSIILLTCVVKLILLPLSAKGYKSMAKMRKMGPEIQRIRETYGDDRQKVSQEMMKFYQKEKINPIGGCLPMVIQMPVFIALYWMLRESVELRHAPFMLWIHDLSTIDPYFILPIIMGASMFLQQQLNPTPPDPTQAKVMKMLPIIFTIFFMWFPAGLVLYWITNNVLSMAQQYFITKQIEKGDARKAVKKA